MSSPARLSTLETLSTYPPRLEPVPVKPLFFDAAWNYIEYPGRQIEEVTEKATQKVAPATKTVEEPKKKGWFFRS